MANKKNSAEMVSAWLGRALSEIPEPTFSGKPSDEVYIRKIIKHSALKSSSVSAALAIPGGALGLVSMLPDIYTVWRIQSQMVSNIAAANGKSALVTSEQMLWCMFRQMGVGMLKEVIVQQGSQFVVKKIGDTALKTMFSKIGHRIVRAQGTKMASKVVPVLGSVSAGALTYYDTWRVGRNAQKLYSSELILLPPGETENRELRS